MKFSFLTYQFCRYPLEYSFKMAQQYGFEGVEVWGARPHAYAYDMTKEALADINAWKKRYSLEVSMFTPEILAYPYSFVSPIAKEREETLQYLIKSAEVAAAIGTDKMQITIPHTGYGVNRETAWSMMLDGVGKLCERASQLGVNIIMETLSPSEGNLLTCTDDLLSLFGSIKSPFLQGMLDLVPPVIANEPFAEYFDKLGEKMAYVHLCNSDGATEFHMALDDPRGVIPMRELFQILMQRGYDGWCSLELLASYFKDPELYLAHAANSINKFCTELNIRRG